MPEKVSSANHRSLSTTVDLLGFSKQTPKKYGTIWKRA